MTMRSGILLVVAGCLLASAASRGQAVKPRVVVPTIAPRAEDVSTIDGMIRAFYEVISGPAGKPASGCAIVRSRSQTSDSSRWISNAVWTDERPDLPIPIEYLPAGK